MAEGLSRGQVWMYAFGGRDKRQPVLVLARQEVIGLLRTVTVAPITSTIHGAPSEVIIGIDEGLKRDSAVNLDHVQTVAKGKIGELYVFAELLRRGATVFSPVVDIRGIDAVVR